MFRLLKPGGVIGNTMWTRTVLGEPWNEACSSLDPEFKPFNSAFSDALKTHEDLEAWYKAAGFVDIQSKVDELYLIFPSAEEYTEYFLYAKNPVFDLMMSSWKGKKEDVRNKMVEIVREKYGDGKLLMISAAVVGRKP